MQEGGDAEGAAYPLAISTLPRSAISSDSATIRVQRTELQHVTKLWLQPHAAAVTQEIVDIDSKDTSP